MTNEYELADDSRESLIYEKQDLLAPLLPGMEEPPHPMRLGDTERDYYLRSGTRLRSTTVTTVDHGESGQQWAESAPLRHDQQGSGGSGS